MSGAYYNEIDPYAAQWLRNLIAAGHIAPGEVDERSIVEVQPDDLKGFTQCHFFAGIGIWSYALRQAGWSDDRSVWTGSCPCQPFSAAGKGEGFADERHLWPAWFRLIRECRPVTFFGEQVASADALAWLDVVSTDVEAEGYAIGAVDTCAAGYGAPHIRQRLYFVAHADALRRERKQSQESAGIQQEIFRPSEQRKLSCSLGAISVKLAHTNGGNPGTERQQRGWEQRLLAQGGGCDELGDTQSGGLGKRGDAPQQGRGGHVDGAEQSGILGNPINPGLEGYARDGAGSVRHEREVSEPDRPVGAPGDAPSACNGFWSDAVWIACRDGKARPTKPGIFPLAYGSASRVGRLRAYGNGICAPPAAEFVAAYLEETVE